MRIGEVLARAAVSLVVVLYLAPPPAFALDLKSLVSPGPLAAAHADVASDCEGCHRPFERVSEGDLCLDCHEAVALDLANDSGFHGRRPPDGVRACRNCHTEHRGRDADIVGLDAETFRHGETDFSLSGEHGRVACGDCHPAGTKHRDAPSDCRACHAKDDSHRGELGEDCARCHDDRGWREARFDHARTKFPLEGRHKEVDCAICHPTHPYDAAPVDCRGCHAVNDVHQGRFGEDCAACHDAAGWKRGRFDHDTRTRFPLLGAHRTTPCESCHGASASAGSLLGNTGDASHAAGATLDTRCIACHRSDDEHRGVFGSRCETCHGPADWRRTDFDHGRDTKFPLVGAHREQACRSCHSDPVSERRAPRNCYACHASDDVHRGHEGDRCATCHEASSWTGRVNFDHDLTRFPLLGLHAVESCEECHQTSAFKDARVECDGCHAREDTHKGALGEDCGACHNPNGWELWQFDHATQTRFPLHGAHATLECRGCHGASDAGGTRGENDCESCHDADDPHRGSFGARCGDCHRDTNWTDLRMRR